MIPSWVLLSVISVACGHVTRDEIGMISCVEEIASQHFTEGLPLVISMPITTSEHALITTNHTYSTGSILGKADGLLEHMHRRTAFPVLISRQFSAATTNIITQTPYSYIILLWPDDNDDLISTLRGILDNILLQDNLLNCRGKFLVVVTDFGKKFPQGFAVTITEILRTNYSIFDTLVMVPNGFESSDITEQRTFDIYTWFPYESQQCGTVKEVVLLGKYNFQNDRCVSTTKLFSASKSPSDMNGCPVRISTWEVRPNSFITSTYKKQDGGVVYQYRGVEIEYLLLLSEIINMRIEFLPPPEYKIDLSEFFVHSLASVFTGEADIAMGSFPLNYRAVSYGEATVPYIYNSYKWYVPCAKPIRKIDNIMNIFPLSVWLGLTFVLFLISLSFWGMANSPTSSLMKESVAYKSLSQTFNYAWSIFMGVSVAQMPITIKLRLLFLLFVGYCFAINTVFQAHFTSYLIEPRFDKQIGTFRELNESGVTYLKHPSLDRLALYMNYFQHNELKIPQEHCENYTECMASFLDGKDATVMVTDIWAEYFAFSMGKTKKSLCAIDENVFTMGLVMYVPKGYPPLQRFNTILQRCVESGLGDKYWSELKWVESLRKSHVGISHSDHGDHGGRGASSMDYFAFTVFHVRVAFCLLGFGSSLSITVFIAEHLTKKFSQ